MTRRQTLENGFLVTSPFPPTKSPFLRGDAAGALRTCQEMTADALEKLHPVMVRFARRRMGRDSLDAQGAEDFVGEAFFRLFSGARRWDPQRCPLETQLYQVISSLISHARRRETTMREIRDELRRLLEIFDPGRGPRPGGGGGRRASGGSDEEADTELGTDGFEDFVTDALRRVLIIAKEMLRQALLVSPRFSAEMRRHHSVGHPQSWGSAPRCASSTGFSSSGLRSRNRTDVVGVSRLDRLPRRPAGRGHPRCNYDGRNLFEGSESD